MSIGKYTNVLCDRCQESTEQVEAGPRAAKVKAKALGWKIGKQKDFCPQCSKEIAEAINIAKSGLSP